MTEPVTSGAHGEAAFRSGPHGVSARRHGILLGWYAAVYVCWLSWYLTICSLVNFGDIQTGIDIADYAVIWNILLIPLQIVALGFVIDRFSKARKLATWFLFGPGLPLLGTLVNLATTGIRGPHFAPSEPWPYLATMATHAPPFLAAFAAHILWRETVARCERLRTLRWEIPPRLVAFSRGDLAEAFGFKA